MVPKWRLKWDSNMRPFGHKAPNLPHDYDGETRNYLSSEIVIVTGYFYSAYV